VKSEERQGAAAVFRMRGRHDPAAQADDRRGLRGHLTEFGEVVPQGAWNARRLAELVEAEDDALAEETARATLQVLVDGLRHLDERIAGLDAEIARRAREDERARRPMTIPGIGPLIATALATLAPPPEHFRRARDLFARQTVHWTVSRSRSPWLGLTPRQHSTGGKARPRTPSVREGGRTLGVTPRMGERSGGLRGPTGATVLLHFRRPLIPGGQRRHRAADEPDGSAGHLARLPARAQAGHAGAGGAGEQRAAARH
jgi:hypothetical protein